MADSSDNGLSVKDFIVAITLLGSAWAMSFGVGLFSAFGMSYIMMFSLSEHITAAIPSALIALLFASLICAAVYASQRLATWAFIVVGAVVILALGGGYHWAWKTFGLKEFSLVVVVAVLLTTGVVLLIKLASEYPTPVFAGLSVGAALVAFLLGHISGSATMASKHVPWQIAFGKDGDSTTYNGPLLYAGEKGVLLVVPCFNRTHYVRMDSIKTLSRQTPEATDVIPVCADNKK